MLPKLSIRTATTNDVELLSRFRYALRSITNPPSSTESEFLPRCQKWMKNSLDTNSGWSAWIAELDQRPIGNIWVQIIEKIPNPTDESEFYGYITNLYIIEELRGRGIGSELLETALDWCRSNDAHAVLLWPSQKSRSLYLRHGFSTPDDLFQLILEENVYDYYP